MKFSNKILMKSLAISLWLSIQQLRVLSLFADNSSDTSDKQIFVNSDNSSKFAPRNNFIDISQSLTIDSDSLCLTIDSTRYENDRIFRYIPKNKKQLNIIVIKNSFSQIDSITFDGKSIIDITNYDPITFEITISDIHSLDWRPGNHNIWLKLTDPFYDRPKVAKLKINSYIDGYPVPVEIDSNTIELISFTPFFDNSIHFGISSFSFSIPWSVDPNSVQIRFNNRSAYSAFNIVESSFHLTEILALKPGENDLSISFSDRNKELPNFSTCYKFNSPAKRTFLPVSEYDFYGSAFDVEGSYGRYQYYINCDFMNIIPILSRIPYYFNSPVSIRTYPFQVALIGTLHPKYFAADNPMLLEYSQIVPKIDLFYNSPSKKGSGKLYHQLCLTYQRFYNQKPVYPDTVSQRKIDDSSIKASTSLEYSLFYKKYDFSALRIGIKDNVTISSRYPLLLTTRLQFPLRNFKSEFSMMWILFIQYNSYLGSEHYWFNIGVNFKFVMGLLDFHMEERKFDGEYTPISIKRIDK